MPLAHHDDDDDGAGDDGAGECGHTGNRSGDCNASSEMYMVSCATYMHAYEYIFDLYFPGTQITSIYV